MGKPNVFQVDFVSTTNMDCLIEGVEYPDDPHRKTRMTLSGRGFTYRLEGDILPNAAVKLALDLPKPNSGIHGCDGRLEGRRDSHNADDFTITVLAAPPSARVEVGAVYGATFYGMVAPLVEAPSEEEEAAPRR